MLNPPMAVENYGSVLKAFSRALRRELHVLIQHPDMLWQQMYNRLKWENEEVDGQVSRVILPEFKRRSSPNSIPWFHNKSRIIE